MHKLQTPIALSMTKPADRSLGYVDTDLPSHHNTRYHLANHHLPTIKSPDVLEYGSGARQQPPRRILHLLYSSCVRR